MSTHPDVDEDPSSHIIDKLYVVIKDEIVEQVISVLSRVRINRVMSLEEIH